MPHSQNPIDPGTTRTDNVDDVLAADHNTQRQALIDLETGVNDHVDDTTSVHGITDTADLVLDDDARLTDARTPTAHAVSHTDGGTDEIAISGEQVTSGTVADARIASTIARDSEVTSAVAAHADNTTGAHAASAISVADTDGKYSGADVEAVLAEMPELAAGEGIDLSTASGTTTVAVSDLQLVPGAVVVVARNAGASQLSNDATETSPWSGTLYSIPAGTLRVGDLHDFWIGLEYIQNSGAGRDIAVTYKINGTTVQSITTSGGLIAAHAVGRRITAHGYYQCMSVGASGSLRFWMNVLISGVAGAPAAYTGERFGLDTTVDTTAAISLGATYRMQSADSTQTVIPKMLQIVKYNAP